ncbi:MAG: HPr family phosphocarrier protein [Candidatus Pacebacteria bacterium]|nr:HPr family phosphocarrier protein [Candidatus Paceibacterota bacterium]
MTSADAKVINGYGIHCRPTTVIVKEAQQYSADIRVTNPKGEDADCKNMLQLLSLGVQCNDVVTISVSGPDEEEVCDKMVKLFETNFDFER